jgi:hypothetical protein
MSRNGWTNLEALDRLSSTSKVHLLALAQQSLSFSETKLSHPQSLPSVGLSIEEVVEALLVDRWLSREIVRGGEIVI